MIFGKDSLTFKKKLNLGAENIGANLPAGRERTIIVRYFLNLGVILFLVS